MRSSGRLHGIGASIFSRNTSRQVRKTGTRQAAAQAPRSLRRRTLREHAKLTSARRRTSANRGTLVGRRRETTRPGHRHHDPRLHHHPGADGAIPRRTRPRPDGPPRMAVRSLQRALHRAALARRQTPRQPGASRDRVLPGTRWRRAGGDSARSGSRAAPALSGPGAGMASLGRAIRSPGLSATAPQMLPENSSTASHHAAA